MASSTCLIAVSLMLAMCPTYAATYVVQERYEDDDCRNEAGDPLVWEPETFMYFTAANEGWRGDKDCWQTDDSFITLDADDGDCTLLMYSDDRCRDQVMRVDLDDVVTCEQTEEGYQLTGCTSRTPSGSYIDYTCRDEDYVDDWMDTMDEYRGSLKEDVEECAEDCDENDVVECEDAKDALDDGCLRSCRGDAKDWVESYMEFGFGCDCQIGGDGDDDDDDDDDKNTSGSTSVVPFVMLGIVVVLGQVQA